MVGNESRTNISVLTGQFPYTAYNIKTSEKHTETARVRDSLICSLGISWI